jgi:hypothetical protein
MYLLLVLLGLHFVDTFLFFINQPNYQEYPLKVVLLEGTVVVDLVKLREECLFAIEYALEFLDLPRIFLDDEWFWEDWYTDLVMEDTIKLPMYSS